MKVSLAMLAGLMLAAILLLPATARADSFSGAVTDSSGHPLSGAGVALAVAGLSTGTASDGTWSLSTGTTGVSVGPAVTATSVTRHLVLYGNHVRLQFDGVDGAGRTVSTGVGAIHESPLQTAKHGAAARSVAAVVDTLLFSWNGRVRARVPTTTFTSGTTQKIDTSTTSADISWTSGITYGSVTDSRDGKVYKTVKIGTQTWMAENLNYKVDSSWCYANSADSCAKYGRLYTWAEVMAGHASSTASPSGVQGVCPTGWHVPSDAEWTKLTDTTLSSSTAGTKLKSLGGWHSGNGTDTYGFRVLPAGLDYGGSFHDIGGYAYLWSASETVASDAWYRDFSNGYANVYRSSSYKTYGFALRCLQD